MGSGKRESCRERPDVPEASKNRRGACRTLRSCPRQVAPLPWLSLVRMTTVPLMLAELVVETADTISERLGWKLAPAQRGARVT